MRRSAHIKGKGSVTRALGSTHRHPPPRSPPTLPHSSCSSTTACTKGSLKAWLGMGRPQVGLIYSEGGGAGDPDVLHSRWVRGLSTAPPCCSWPGNRCRGAPGRREDQSLWRGWEPRQTHLCCSGRERLWSSRERAARLPLARPWIGSPSRPSAQHLQGITTG